MRGLCGFDLLVLYRAPVVVFFIETNPTRHMALIADPINNCMMQSIRQVTDAPPDARHA
jgi:hypothetical protein